MPKDLARAKEWLEEFLATLKELEGPRGFDYPGQEDLLLSLIYRKEDRVKKVVGDLVPNQAWYSGGGSPDWIRAQRGSIERALGVLADREELARHWSSESVIEIDTDALHPWVWDAAKGLWDSEHWGEAVEAAVKVLQVKLQEKSRRRDLSGTRLVAESLRLDPPEHGEVRLRVLNDDRSDTYKSAQQGAMFLGQAVFMFWRNQLSHEPIAMARQPALEGLAAASAFARVIESSTVVGDDDDKALR